MTFGLGVVIHDGKANIWVAEVDYHEFKASLGSTVRPCIKKIQTKQSPKQINILKIKLFSVFTFDIIH